MAFELGQVEVRAAAALEQPARVVEEVQAEVEERRADGLAVDEDVLFGQVPAARTHQQRGGLVVEAIDAAVRVVERDGALDGVDQVDLAFEHVLPGRRVGVLEVGHVHVGARVEGVDEHLAIGRAGQLDPALLQVGVVTGATCQSPSRTWRVSGRKSGSSPASKRAWRSWRAWSSAWRVGLNSRCRRATNSSAGRGQHVVEAREAGSQPDLDPAAEEIVTY